MKKILLLLCSICMISLSGCQSTLKKYSTTSTDLGFDTIVSFVAYSENEATFKQYSDLLAQEFKRYDQLFDKYNTYEGIHNIKTINDAAGKEPVKVDKEIIELLTLSKQYDTLTNHQFDITMGSILNVWHNYREAGLLANQKNEAASIPSMEELQNAATHIGWEHIHMDKDKSTVYIDDPEVSLDVGGNAKGFAVEKIAQLLEDKGCKHAILNGGGNIRLIGDKPESENWSVGIQIPNLVQLESDSLISIKINTSMSLVTSGDYQRYYMYGNQIMHHIIDPTTWMPARHCRSVTVISKDSGIADILSTTLYTLSHKDGMKLITDLQVKEGLQINAIWVYDEQQPIEDGTSFINKKGYQIIVTDGIKDQIVQ